MANSKFDNFIGKYSTIRKELQHLFLYGCYSRDDFLEIRKAYDVGKGTSGRKYDNERRRIQNAIGIEHFTENFVNRSKVVGFSFDMFEDNRNYLFDTYRISTFSPNDIHYYHFILQVVRGNDEGLTKAEIIHELAFYFPKGQVPEETTLGNYLKRMADEGYLHKNKVDNKFRYSYPTDPFEHFNEDEIIALYDAICFYRNIAITSVPGYFLSDTISRYLLTELKHQVPEANPFVHKHLSYNRIIDDEVTTTIFYAIDNGNDIELSYTSARQEPLSMIMTPMHIITEYVYGRQYVYGFSHGYRKAENVRIDRIISVKVMKRNSEPYAENTILEPLQNTWTIAMARDRQSSINVTVDFIYKDDKQLFILHRLEREKKHGSLEIIESGHCRFTIDVADPTEMKPWLRSFPCQVNIHPSESHQLAQELTDGWKETLNRYGAL